MAPELLELELTESMIMHDADGAVALFNELKRLGLKLSIDDFGTGYSSLAYLKKFPIDKLKIDKSFIRDIQTDPDDVAIIKAIVSMSHSLGIKVVAEGVETKGQLEFLREIECDEAQGYLFSKPLLASDMEDLLRRQIIDFN